MPQRWWLRPLLLNHAGQGRWMGCGKCSTMPCAVRWPPRGTCWPGAAELWSMKCRRECTGQMTGVWFISLLNYINCVHSENGISNYVEYWRIADKPKATWNVHYTMQRGGRNQYPAHPRLAIFQFIFVRFALRPVLFPLSSISTLLLHFVDWSPDYTPALPAADKEKATASRLSDPLSSSPPSRYQETKSQQPPQLRQPDGVRHWRRGVLGLYRLLRYRSFMDMFSIWHI